MGGSTGKALIGHLPIARSMLYPYVRLAAKLDQKQDPIHQYLFKKFQSKSVHIKK
jgi:hypothetical protein